jgi:hypothetical protein
MDGGRDCAARIHLHLPKLRFSPGFQLSITFRSTMITDGLIAEEEPADQEHFGQIP